MANLTIEEIKKLKAEAERKILKEIQKLEKLGINIESISLDRLYYIDGKIKTENVVMNVTL